MQRIKGLSIINILILIGLIADYFFIQPAYNQPHCIVCVCICVFQMLMLLSNNKEFNRVVVRPTMVFVFALFVVFVQSYIDLILGNFTPVDNAFRFPNTINKGVCLSAIAFTCFTISYNQYKQRRIRVEVPKNEAYWNSRLRVIAIINALFFLYWLTTLSAEYLSGAAYLSSGAYDENHTSYPELFYKISMYVAFVIFVKSFKDGENLSLIKVFSRMPKLILIPVLLYIVILLMAGDRGNAVYSLFLFFFSFIFITKKKVKLIVVLPILALGAIVMTSLSYGRQYGDELSFQDKMTYVSDNQEILQDVMVSFSPFTAELAQSSSCTHIALNDVLNNGHPLHYGEFHFCYGVQLIPWLGSQVLQVLHIEPEQRSSSEYITVSYSGKNYRSGFGTNLIADYYLDFGLIGVILEFLFLGVLFKKIDWYYTHSTSKEIPWWILAIVLLSAVSAIVMPRTYLLYHVRTYLYIVVFYLLVDRVVVPVLKNK